MKRYRVESRSGENHFRADCTEEELEYWKALCKYDSIENNCQFFLNHQLILRCLSVLYKYGITEEIGKSMVMILLPCCSYPSLFPLFVQRTGLSLLSYLFQFSFCPFYSMYLLLSLSLVIRYGRLNNEYMM